MTTCRTNASTWSASLRLFCAIRTPSETANEVTTVDREHRSGHIEGGVRRQCARSFNSKYSRFKMRVPWIVEQSCGILKLLLHTRGEQFGTHRYGAEAAGYRHLARPRA